MQPFNLDSCLEVLERTPRVLYHWLGGLSDTWTMHNEGPETWSPYDVIGHLIHGERTDWIPRAKIILQFGEARPFEPFDRLAQQHESEGRTLPELLDLFRRLRTDNLAELHALKLQPSDLERRGRHPALGVVTLGQLMSTWAVHDLTHLHQISRVMAHQYREAVGPWHAYLGVLRCEGHSD